VAQAVLLPGDARLGAAVAAAGVEQVTLPPEPRHVSAWADADGNPTNPLVRYMRENVAPFEWEGLQGRRGPRLGPTPAEAASLPEMASERSRMLAEDADAVAEFASSLQRMPTEDFDDYVGGSTKGKGGDGSSRWGLSRVSAAPSVPTSSRTHDQHISQQAATIRRTVLRITRQVPA
jgi:hypothetical protein